MRSFLVPRSVLVDSSASLALADADDDHHHQALAIERQLQRSRPRLFLTNFLIDETYTLLLTRIGYAYALRFLDRAERGTITIIPITPADEVQARHLLRRYTDKEYSYTDATSFVIMQRLGIEAAFTFDQNFSQHGIQVLMP